jgi:hypothetical protein
MALALTHTFVSGKADGADATQVQPSNWNATHTVVCTADTYTPTVSASSGAGGSVSASGEYFAIGKFVTFRAYISISNNGTWAGYMTCTLPSSAARHTAFVGVDEAAGTILTCHMHSTSSATAFRIYTATGTYPGATGKTFAISGSYEST